MDTIRTLSTSPEQIDLGDISEVGMVAVQNFNTGVAEDVLVSWDNSNYDVRCPAEASILTGAPVGTSAVWVKSRSGTPVARIFINPA